MKRTYIIAIIITLGMLGNTRESRGQNQPSGPDLTIADSLSLPEILTHVLTSYPAVSKAMEAIKAAEAGIGLARSGYYPNIQADAGYTRLGPVPELSIPNMGSFKIMPENNFDAGVSIGQTVYDFSKTSRRIKLEESTRDMAEANVDLVRQQLTLITAVSYYTLVYLQEAIRIKDEQIANLQKHLDFVTRKEQTGSATEYEILSTQVRLSNAQNQRVSLETSRQTQVAILNSLIGLPIRTPLIMTSRYISSQPDVSSDSLIPFALEHRNEMLLARLRQEHAMLKLRSVKVQNNPSLNAFLAGGWKNGYIPDLNKITPNYAAGLSITMTVFDATRHKYNIRLANSSIEESRFEMDNVSRDIATEVFQNETSLDASETRIDQGQLQVKQAEEALHLAAVSFQSGGITNLDLLDAETALEESRINLLRAQIDHAINLVRLNISLGNKIE
ncbi:MAG: TolC family protein [Bacteroidetes bacterium]|nr:MAG: TolC family protein [Bacteroidota bacterium]